MTEDQRLVAELLSGDELRAEAAVEALARLGPPALDALLPALRSDSPEARWWATRAVAAIPDRRSTAALTEALDDPDASVRQAAALGLRLQPSPDAADRLARLLTDDDPITARLASDALAALGPRALTHLTAAARSPDAGARIHAVRALARAREPHAIPTLFEALEDPSAMVRHWAERGLEDLGVGMVFFPPT